MEKPIDPPQAARREFLFRAGGAAGAAWISAQWPAILAAAQHAHQTTSSKSPAKLEVLSPEQARQVEAVASQIIPTDDLPGAREAGVVYFIDRALKTFASDTLPVYQAGLAHLNELTSAKYRGTKSFADATVEQQEAVLTDLATGQGNEQRRLGAQRDGDFFQTVRIHTILGFLVDPSAGGNRDYVGWKVIGRDPDHTFSPPYGYYDNNYPGWEAAKAKAEAEKK
jgi:Gluconate 2-dehydrogenase subunit 3